MKNELLAGIISFPFKKDAPVYPLCKEVIQECQSDSNGDYNGEFHLKLEFLSSREEFLIAMPIYISNTFQDKYIFLDGPSAHFHHVFPTL